MAKEKRPVTTSTTGKWFAPPSGGYSAKLVDDKPIRPGKPPKTPATPEGIRAAQAAKNLGANS